MPRTRTIKTEEPESKDKARKRRAAHADPSPASRQTHRRIWQVLFMAGIAIGAFAIVALASYDARDPSFSRATSGTDISNLCGQAGAWTSDLALQLLGWSAWVVALLPLYFARRLAGRPGLRLGGVIAGLLLLLGLSTAFQLGIPEDPERSFPPGGAIGMQIALWLIEVVGRWGAWIVTLGAAAIGGTLVLGVDWEQGAGAVMAQVERAPKLAGAGFVGSIRWLGAGVKRSALAILAFLRTGTENVKPPSTETSADVAPPSVPARTVEAAKVDAPPAREKSLIAEPLPPRVETPVAPVSKAHIERAPGKQSPEPPPAERGSTIAGSLDFVEPPSPLRDRPTAQGSRVLVEAVWEVTEDSAELPVRKTPPPEPVGPVKAPGLPLQDHAPRTRARPTSASVAAEEFPVLVPNPAPPEQVAARTAPPKPARVRRAEPRGPVSFDPENLVSGGNDEGGRVIVPTDPGTPFELPTLSLLDRHERDVVAINEDELHALARSLEEKLASFGVQGEVKAIRPGPVITTFEYLPAPGIKISRIASLSDDIAMAMKALRVRIVAPIPGRGVVGIEIPNKQRQTVWIRDILSSEVFRDGGLVLPLALGKNVEGRPVVTDLTRMPHLLIGGTTGSGKSVGINAMMISMLYTRTPEELRFLLVDPKMLEFEIYQDIPHLIHPVVTDVKLANAALKWAVAEMERRYRLLARWESRSIDGYNTTVDKELASWSPQRAQQIARRDKVDVGDVEAPKRLPHLVIVIDELADLMMQSPKEVEESIVRLAQKARASGIHLMVATQRPSVDVITGLIKANMPARVAYQVRSKTDGRTILDQNGAEALLGKGDLLYLPPGVSALQRVHGPFVSDEEARTVADYLRSQSPPQYEADIRVPDDDGDAFMDEEEYDECYDMAVKIVADAGRASTSMVQRHLKIGYNRAARIIERMEKEGIVGPADGARPRDVLVGRGNE